MQARRREGDPRLNRQDFSLNFLDMGVWSDALVHLCFHKLSLYYLYFSFHLHYITDNLSGYVTDKQLTTIFGYNWSNIHEIHWIRLLLVSSKCNSVVSRKPSMLTINYDQILFWFQKILHSKFYLNLFKMINNIRFTVVPAIKFLNLVKLEFV